MLTALLAVSTAVCAINWVRWWVACAATMLYMVEKDYTLPTDSEQEACCQAVWLKIFSGGF